MDAREARQRSRYYHVFSTACATSVLCSLLSLFLESKPSTCLSNCRLWLYSVSACFLVIWILFSFHEAIARGLLHCQSVLGPLNGFIQALTKIFSLVWVASGVYLIATWHTCGGPKPVCYYFVISYVILSALFAGSFLVRLQCCDLQPIVENNGEEGDSPAQTLTYAALTEERKAQLWLDWLGNRGCFPETIWVSASGSGPAVSHEDVQVALGEEYVPVRLTERDFYCPICLSALDLNALEAGTKGDPQRMESFIYPPTEYNSEGLIATVSPDDNTAEVPSDAEASDSVDDQNANRIQATIVAFPCTSRHTFHVSCLVHWLQSCQKRRVRGVSQAARLSVEEAITCPCCREGPAAGSGPAL